MHRQTIELATQRLGNKAATILKGPIASAAVGTFSIKIINIGLGFAIALVLSRTLGAAGYGAYVFAFSVIGLMTVPALLGLDGLLVREIADYRARAQWGLIRGILLRSNFVVLVVSAVVTLLAAGIVWHFMIIENREMLLALSVALISLPIRCMTRLRQAAMQGHFRIITAQLPETLIHRAILLVAIAIVFVAFADPIHPAFAVALHVGASAVAFLFGVWMLYSALSVEVKTAQPEFQTQRWLKAAPWFLIISGMAVINSQTGIIMLGIIEGAESTGIYSIVVAYALFISFITQSISTPLLPRLVNFNAVGETDRFRDIVTKAARSTFVLSLPVCLAFILLGHQLLRIFGPDFVRGDAALGILSVGYMISSAIGRGGGPALIATGLERYSSIAVGISAVSNVILNAAFIPQWGIEGAALATATSMVLTTALMAFWARQKIGFHATGFGVILRNVN